MKIVYYKLKTYDKHALISRFGILSEIHKLRITLYFFRK